jgi:hypothetical protein
VWTDAEVIEEHGCWDIRVIGPTPIPPPVRADAGAVRITSVTLGNPAHRSELNLPLAQVSIDDANVGQLTSQAFATGLSKKVEVKQAL